MTEFVYFEPARMVRLTTAGRVLAKGLYAQRYAMVRLPLLNIPTPSRHRRHPVRYSPTSKQQGSVESSHIPPCTIVTVCSPSSRVHTSTSLLGRNRVRMAAQPIQLIFCQIQSAHYDYDFMTHKLDSYTQMSRAARAERHIGNSGYARHYEWAEGARRGDECRGRRSR